MRLTAEYSKDKVLEDFILYGDADLHNLVSTTISKYLLGQEIKVTKKNNPIVEKYNKKIRDIGKMINLGIDYGKSAFSIKDDLNITQKEAQKLLDIIKAKTPQKEKYFQDNFKFVEQNGYIIIDKLTNRRCYFSNYEEYIKLKNIKYEDKSKEDISRFYKIKGEMERFARNYPIQGSGGTILKLSSILFYNKMLELNLQNFCYIVNLVHDEIVVETNIENQEKVKKILENSMIEAGKYLCKTIPMKVDPVIGDNWGAKV